MNEALTRLWCEALAQALPCDVILRRGRPYLHRYYVAGWKPTKPEPAPALFLHHFVESDEEDRIHSHPWFGVSLILSGAYREFRYGLEEKPTTRDFHAGDVNELEPRDWHRIRLLTPDCWTLFLAGRYVQPWGFIDLSTGAGALPDRSKSSRVEVKN